MRKLVITAAVTKLKHQSGRNILIAGSGKRLFDHAAMTGLKLIGTQEFGTSGIIVITYGPTDNSAD